MSRQFRQAALPFLFASILSGMVALPITAQDRSCTLEPIALPLFDATPAAVIASSPGTTTDAPTLDENGATDAVEMLLICAGEEAQALRYAIFTDSYLAGLFLGEDPADQPAFERMIATGAVPDAMTPTLDGISDLETQDDGRVGVTIEVTSAGGTVQDRVVLAWDDSQEAWLIDEIVSLNPPPATPAS